MKIDYNSNYHIQSDFVKLKDNEWLIKQRTAGKVAAQTLSLLESLVKEKTTKSLIELDKIAEEFIRNNGCTPTFFHYKGFPNNVCISVNKQLVHGVCTDYILKDGDVVSFDLGTTFEGVIADTALTCIFGEPKSKEHLNGISATKKCLENAIKSIEVGKRIGVIGNAIFKTARDKGFNVIDTYGGHGICITQTGEGIPHAQPFITNKSTPDKGIRIQPGLVIAIEPLLVPYTCSTKTKVSSDGWTVYTEDISYHEEHTIFIHEDKVEVITKRENEDPI